MSSNGFLTAGELSPATGGVAGPDPGQGQLASSGAAAAWNAMGAKALATHGVHIGCNGPDSMYRPYASQVRLRNEWCAQGACQNAAVPGTSNHGIATAVDQPLYSTAICDSPEFDEFGWNKRYSDAPWEAWHRHYGGTYHGKDPGGGGHRDPTPLLHVGSKQSGAVKRAQKHLRRWNIGLTRPSVDGDFGPTTRKAVVQFQVVHDLKPDGKIGNATWAALRRIDHFLADERWHLNNIRLAKYRRDHGGVSKTVRQKMRRWRTWCGKRATAIYKTAQDHGWSDAHRSGRFKTLKAASGKGK